MFTLSNVPLMPSGYPGGYAAYYQQVIKPAEDAIPASVREANDASHAMGIVDDCYRCIVCEIGSWNAWKERCPA